MASSTRGFLTDGPIAGDPGDITAGSAYHVVWRQIGQAITDAADKNADNSKQIIDELKALRTHLKEVAEKSPNKRISELPPDVAREFLEVSRSIKAIATGPGAPSPTPHAVHSHSHYRYRGHGHDHGTGVVNAAFTGRGPIGVAAMAGADALVPGMGIVVKAVQEHSQIIKDTFLALWQIPKAFNDSIKFTIHTFKAIHNFLNPINPYGLVQALSKLFGGKGGGGSGGGGILSFLKNYFTTRIITRLLKSVFSRLGIRFIPLLRLAFRGIGVIGVGLVADYLLKKATGEGALEWVWKLGGKLNQAIDFITGQDSDKKSNSGGTTRSFLNPDGGVVPGGQVNPPSVDLHTRGIKTPVSFNEGFNFNTGIGGDESDTIIQLMMKQTNLLSEILRALLGKAGSAGQGYIRALQGGGTVPPGETALVGEDSAEHVQAGGQSGTVNGPALLTAGKDPVQVSPGDKPQTRSLTVGSTATGTPSTAIGSPATAAVSQISQRTTVTPLVGRDSEIGRQTFKTTDSTIYYTGPERTGGQKTTSVTYTDPATGQTYTDRTPPIGPPSSRLPSETPGIAFGYRNFPKHGRETLGGYYLVTPQSGVNAGESFILPHSDAGPGAGKGERLDYNAPAAMQVFGSMKESAVQGGSYIRYLGPDLPEGVVAGKQPSEGISERYNLSPQHSAFIQQQSEARRKSLELTGYTPVPGTEQGGTPSSRIRSSLRHETESVKGASPQQNANLSVKNNVATADDHHRNINALKDQHRQIRGKKARQSQVSQQQPQQQAPGRKRASHSAAMTNVGMVALSSGSGFG